MLSPVPDKWCFCSAASVAGVVPIAVVVAVDSAFVLSFLALLSRADWS